MTDDRIVTQHVAEAVAHRLVPPPTAVRSLRPHVRVDGKGLRNGDRVLTQGFTNDPNAFLPQLDRNKGGLWREIQRVRTTDWSIRIDWAPSPRDSTDPPRVMTIDRTIEWLVEQR